jgi:hypothetical protein
MTGAGLPRAPEVNIPTDMAHSLRYLEPVGALKPADAVVAIIADESGRYLVQLLVFILWTHLRARSKAIVAAGLAPAT